MKLFFKLVRVLPVPGQLRRTERGLSSPQQASPARPDCESGAGRRSNGAADWKVRAPRFAPAFTDRILLPPSQKGFNVSTLQRFFLSILLLTLAYGAAFPASVHAAEADLLARRFLCLPDSARPWVFWFWLNGNLSSNGMTADLEAMKRVGLGGVVIMEVDQGTPKGPVAFGSPAWLDLFRHVCSQAHHLGLQVSMNNDAGWCGSGGPWITPELSMQKVVWSERTVNGPGRFDGVLEQPETVAGFYRDIGAFAFPTPPEDAVEMADYSPKLTSGSRAMSEERRAKSEESS